MRKLYSVIFSPCGGTRNASRGLTRDLVVGEYDITLPPGRLEPLSFGPGDFVFSRFTVYGGRAPANIIKLFAKIKGEETPRAMVAVYGNRDFDVASRDLYGATREAGFAPAAAVAAVAEHSLAPTIASSRPDAVDLEILAAWGKK